ncbi:MAG: glycosyltransferase family 9 protein [Ignavibacteria bacterium]|jgi:heptosyltransferase-2
MKILIITLSGIGDALMFTPALKLLKEKNPATQIDAMVMFKGAAEILENNPYLSNIHLFDFLHEGTIRSLKYLLRLRGKYNATINVYPANRKEYNLISYLIGAKKRVGVNYKRSDLQNFGYLNNVRIREDDNSHNVITNIKMCDALLENSFEEKPPLEMYLNVNDKNFADKYFQEIGIENDEVVIGFHPGCATLKNHMKRRWEPEKFSALGKLLIDNYNAKILIFGGSDENELKEEILNRIKSANTFAVNTKSILQSAAIMKRCNVFVTNDSSQMHIASALQLKVVAIIGPTNTNYIHPWKTEHRIISLNLDCAPCFFYSPRPLICSRDDLEFKCIKELTVDMVYGAVKSYL